MSKSDSRLLWYDRGNRRIYAENGGETIIFRATDGARGGWQRLSIDKAGKQTWKFARLPLSIWMQTIGLKEQEDDNIQ